MAVMNYPRRTVYLAVAALALIALVDKVSFGQGPRQAAVVRGPATFPLEYKIVDPDNPKNAKLRPGEKLPPLIVMFPGGKTVEDKDATGPIGRLESFRGKSKLIPESNDNPGLPVFMTGLRFHQRLDATGKQVEGYDIELQGEFNAVKVAAPNEAMQDFLEGKKATFELESKLNYGVIATVSTTKLEISRDRDKLFIWSVEGDFTFREGFYSYKSPSLKLAPPTNRPYLYYGSEGKLPQMRIL